MGPRQKSSTAVSSTSASTSPAPTGDSPTSVQRASTLETPFVRQLLPPPLSRQPSLDQSAGEGDPFFELPVTRPPPIPPVLGQAGLPVRAASSSHRVAQLVLAPFEQSRIMTRNRRTSERPTAAPVASTSTLPARRNWSGSSASESGGLSDGDPPGYGPIEPVDALSLTTSQGGTKDKVKRTYEELEDIVFSNPKQFSSMAFAIAASRGTTLVIADDRTTKSFAPYMHLCCAYRRAGCPLILKLIKAKEGGWLMKASNAPDAEPKQRSVYRCRHPLGAKPDLPAVPPAFPAHLSAPPPPRAASQPAQKATIAPAPAETVLGVPEKRKVGRPRKIRPVVVSDADSDLAAAGPAQAPAPVVRAAKVRTSMASTKFSAPAAPGTDGFDREKILAPPFERSLSLATLIAPALMRTSNGWPTITSSGLRASGSSVSELPRSFLPAAALSYRPSILGSAPATSPYVRRVDEPPSKTLGSWTAFLEALDSSLVDPFAAILSSSTIDVSPESFFAESEEMRVALIDEIQGVGKWAIVKLRTKVVARGVDVWRAIGADGSESASAPVARLDKGKGRQIVESAPRDEEINGVDSTAGSVFARRERPLSPRPPSVLPSPPADPGPVAAPLLRPMSEPQPAPHPQKRDDDLPDQPDPSPEDEAPTPSDAPDFSEFEVEADPSIDGEELAAPEPDSDVDGAEIDLEPEREREPDSKPDLGPTESKVEEEYADDEAMDTGESDVEEGDGDGDGDRDGDADVDGFEGLVITPVVSQRLLEPEPVSEPDASVHAQSDSVVYASTREKKRKAELELARAIKKADPKCNVPRPAHVGPLTMKDLKFTRIPRGPKVDASLTSASPLLAATPPPGFIPPPFLPPPNLQLGPSTAPPSIPFWRSGGSLFGVPPHVAAPTGAPAPALPSIEPQTQERLQALVRKYESDGSGRAPADSFRTMDDREFAGNMHPVAPRSALFLNLGHPVQPHSFPTSGAYAPPQGHGGPPSAPRAFYSSHNLSQSASPGGSAPRASLSGQQVPPVAKGSYERKGAGMRRRERSVE